MLTSLFAVLPILISFLVYIQSIKKDSLSLISELAKEISSVNPSAYVIEHLVSNIHSMRPIPFNTLNVLLKRDNSFEILTLLSRCRRVLNLVAPRIVDECITFEYTRPFSTLPRRFLSMALCVAMAIFCFYETLNLTEMLIENYWMIDFYQKLLPYRVSKEKVDMLLNGLKNLCLLYFLCCFFYAISYHFYI